VAAVNWRPTYFGTGPHNETCARYDCVEHPRVFRIVQTDAEGAVRDLYYVEGLANHWPDADGAIAASEANP
jgi:hypothetical protein